MTNIILNNLKNKPVKEIADKVLMTLVLCQMVYIFVSFFSSNSDTLTINLPYYSPIGFMISCGVIYFLVYALSYTYEIMSFLLKLYIGIMSLKLILFYTVGTNFEKGNVSITIAPWTLLDSAYLGLAVVGLIVLAPMNRKYNLSYRGKLYWRWLKFKFHVLIHRPLLK